MKRFAVQPLHIPTGIQSSVYKLILVGIQARGDWLKRQQQADAGHTALAGLMDALLHLQQGTVDPRLVSA